MDKKEVNLTAVSAPLKGYLTLPDQALGLVIMGKAHEKSMPLDRLVEAALTDNNMATFSIDLLTPKEGVMDRKQFNIDLLTERLIAVTHWLQDNPLTSALNIGYYGSGLEAATALRSAAGLHHQIKAVVCLGGDLSDALPVLYQITAPAFLIALDTEQQEMEVYLEAFELITTTKSFKFMEEDNQSLITDKAHQISIEISQWFKKSLTVSV